MTQEQAKLLGDTLREFKTMQGLKQTDFSSPKRYGQAERGELKIVNSDELHRWCDEGYYLTKGRGYFYEQRIYLLGLAGHIPPTPVPSITEINQRMTPFIRDMELYPYPVAISDIHMRFWGFTRSVQAVLPFDLVEKIIIEKMVGFKVLYEMYQRGILKNYHQVMENSVKRYKLIHLYRQHETSFLAYPEVMQPILGSNYSHFEEVWRKYDWSYLRTTMSDLNALSSSNFNRNPFHVQLRDENNTHFELELKSYPVVGYGHFFVVSTYEPSGYYAESSVESIFKNLAVKYQGTILAWKPPYNL